MIDLLITSFGVWFALVGIWVLIFGVEGQLDSWKDAWELAKGLTWVIFGGGGAIVLVLLILGGGIP